MTSFASNSMVRVIGATLAACLVTHCGAPTEEDSAPMTTLTEKGNHAVADRFGAYVTKPTHCPKPQSPAVRRVMVTGFGLFSGIYRNISGVVTDGMAAETFWPDVYRPGQSPSSGVLPENASWLGDEDFGARVRSRHLVLDGQPVQVCFLTLDVLWDLAAAITIFEAEIFRPELIIMTGRGGTEAVLEGGARNDAAKFTGYRFNGDPDAENLPVLDHVLPPSDPGVEPTIAMTWDNKRLATAVKPIVAAMDRDFVVSAPHEARTDNRYICNNVSYVVAHALKGIPVRLAGELLTLKLTAPHARIGFFHYPATAKTTPDEVYRWGEVIATMISRSLGTP